MEKNYPTVLPDFHLTGTHIKLLKYARTRIKEGSSECVCLAIRKGVENPESAGLNNRRKRLTRAGSDLGQFIRRAIKNSVYFDVWQRQNGISRMHSEVQKDRAMWIKYILENAPGHSDA